MHMHIHIHMNMHVHIHIHSCIHKHIHTGTYTYTYTDTDTSTCTDTYTDTDTYPDTYTYTPLMVARLRWRGQVMLLLFFMFSLSMIFVAFFITTLVRRVRSAVSIGTLVLIIGLVFMFVIFSGPVAGYIWWEQGTSPAGWAVLMFLPPFNFGALYLMIATLSAGSYDFATDSLVAGPGFTWSQLFQPIPAASQPTFGTFNFPLPVQFLYFLLWNMAFYALLTWYCDNVIPDEFGQRRPLYFFLMPSYWGCGRARRRKPVTLTAPPRETDEDDDVYEARCRALDASQADAQAVRLTELRKVYNDGLLDRKAARKVAVSNSSWGLESGKLLALLGQNGAGKTTTINMLCGFTPPTSGDAYLHGLSIRDQMDEIRESMGVCPQFDILFPDLTAREHIELFCGIKDIDVAMVPTVVHERLQAVRLWKVCTHTHTHTHTHTSRQRDGLRNNTDTLAQAHAQKQT
jgi:ABC-type multidrug transport system fused ATPase/permease subunit